MIAKRVFLSMFFIGVASVSAANADERVPDLSPADFERLFSAIKPQQGESPWREIPWLTNVTEARRKASAENKPLVIFTAADGSPLSRT
jgi:hypothetical protein